MVEKLYKNGFKRAVTFSFDDGTAQDIRLVGIFNEYGLKATFNVMGGKCNNPAYGVKENGVRHWDGTDDLRALYSGHEIASHSYTHPHLLELTDQECDEQIDKDVAALEKAFGYKIRGFATPYGKSDDRIKAALIRNGIVYRRSTGNTLDYSVPDDFYDWKPSPHFRFYTTEEGREFIKNFFKCENELPLLDIWGHSYEINELDAYGFEKWNGLRDRWSYVKELCKSVAGHDDTWYATNIEICDYLMAMKSAIVSDTYIDNPTDTELFFKVNGTLIVAPPHCRFGF